MTKESFENYDKTRDVYCECCKQYKPVSSFSYSNIRTNERTARRCKTCNWFYRNYHGDIPNIENYNKSEIIETVKFILEDNDIYINTLSYRLNKSISDLIRLVYELNIKNMPIKVKSKCECCGKDIENTLSAYMSTKNTYCSLECYWEDKPNKIEHGENNQFYNRIETTCTNCGKTIKIIPYDYNKINKYGDNHNFCSQQCYWEYRSKYYISDKSPKYHYQYTEEQIEQHRKILLNRLKKSDRLETKIQNTVDNLLCYDNINFEREKIFDYYAVDNY